MFLSAPVVKCPLPGDLDVVARDLPGDVDGHFRFDVLLPGSSAGVARRGRSRA